MGVFSSDAFDGHTHVLYGSDDRSGLRAIIAVHSTVLGPALGGTRFYPYDSESDALTDALRLSKAMTLKNAAAGLDLGGGKAVVIGDPAKDKSELLLRAYGRFIDSLNGLFITAEDVGTTSVDMHTVSRETRWVAGEPESEGGSGDPSPATALGVYSSLLAVADHLWGSADLRARRVAVQGVGKVGHEFVRLLTEAGAEVLVADINPTAVSRAVEDLGAKAVPLDEILTVDCDILAPCALGSVLNEQSIPRLGCEAVAGSANNQLATDADADRLQARGILYAPDFVVNAGGVINIADELDGFRPSRARRRVESLRATTSAVLRIAAERGINPHVAAVAMAEERIENIAGLRRMRRGSHDRT